jgi:iron complex outermembrane receptor protein
MKKREFFRGFVIFYLVLGFSTAAFAKEAVDDLSLADLMNLEMTTATKTAMKESEAPSIVSVITAEEIKNMGARNIVDVLRTVPGFDLTLSSATATYQMNIRGMRSSAQNDKVKLMIDGHSMSALFGNSQQLFNATPIANIKQIEIIRGPGSALYGTGAFLGVVNIITKKGGDEPSQVAVEGGSFGTVKPYGTLSYKKDDLRVALYGDYYSTDGYKKSIDSDLFGTRPRSAAPGDTTTASENQTLHADIRYKELYFSGFFQKMDMEIPVGVSNALTDGDDGKMKYAYGEIGYKLSIAARGNLQVRAFYDYAEQNALVEIFSEETAAAVYGWKNGQGIFGLPYAENSIMGGEISAAYKIAKGIQFVAGTSYEYYKQFDPKSYANANIIGRPLVFNGITYAPMQYLGGMTDISENANWIKEANRTIYALYGQGIFDIRDIFSLKKGVESLSLTAGVRYDNYDDFGSSVNPRFGLVYAPTSDLYFKMLYGTAFRAPNFKELYAINNTSGVGNENLNPEKISTSEALIGYNFAKNLKGSLTFFDVRAKDLVQIVSPVTPGLPRTYNNIGEMESNGIEAELKLLFGKQRYAYLNFTLQDVKDTTHATIRSAGGQIYTQEDFNPGSVPKFYGNIGVNYDITDHIILNTWVNYVGERDRTEAKAWSGENLVPVDARDPVKDRALVNATLTFRNFYKGLELQLSGFNLFNADHRDPEPSGAVKNDLPLAGTSFIGRVSYSF